MTPNEFMSDAAPDGADGGRGQTFEIPDFALVVLIGATGAGKSFFARRWFSPTEIISSDHARGLVCDDENDQTISADAFDLVRAIADKRLKNRRLAVIDATNVRAAERRDWVELARRWHALPIAIVLDPGLETCVARNKLRPDRNFGHTVPQRMIADLRRGLRGLEKEGFRKVVVLRSVERIEAARLARVPLWTDRRDDSGPFDIIGDVHGCADELEILLGELGYGVRFVEADGERVAQIDAPHGRRLAFVGDLVDRGPRTPDALRIAMAAVEAGGYCVMGNHDQKLARWMSGAKVKISHGLQDSIDQLGAESEAFRQKAHKFLRGLRSHFWLDGGALAIAHAGVKEEMIGRGSPAVRAFTLYGETNGEVDEFGLPVRQDWAAAYRGRACVVYGHTPVVKPTFIHNTACLDSGCAFGGALTALRWPERAFVAVPAIRAYAQSLRPPIGAAPAQPVQNAPAEDIPDLADVMGRRWIETRLHRRVVVAADNASAALEAMTRFAIAPQWLIYLPPTMSPVATSARPDWLERPEEAFAYYAERGQRRLIAQEKHMGSRALVIVCRDADAARARFNVRSGESGVIYTRAGRSFFADAALTEKILAVLREAAKSCGLWDELESDWLLLDAEIMPWSAKAAGLIDQQFAPVAATANAGLQAAVDAAQAARARGVDLAGFDARLLLRRDKAAAYARAWAPYAWPTDGLDGLKIAPFHLLSSEGAVHFDKPHVWHMEKLDALVAAGATLIAPTQRRFIDLDDPASQSAAIAWWEEMTQAGGEGMVVKPWDFIAHSDRGLIQPAIKVRGREYLRIIYGPEYDLPAHLERLRKRGLSAKRNLALREFALGHEGLARFVAHAPFARVHECVFAVLALESEPVDPRL